MSEQTTFSVTLPPHSLGMAHRLWRTLPAGPRRVALSTLTAALAPRVAREAAVAPGLVVAGELGRASGLGEGARLMLAALRGAGFPHIGCDIGDPARRERIEIADVPAAMPLVLHVNAPLLPLTLLRLPRSVLRGRRRIGFWYWELPHVPESWRPGFDLVDEIWVPSRFVAESLETVSTSKPIRIVTLPLAAVPPQPSRKQRADFGLPEGVLVVLVSLSLASSVARKNPLAAIAAFRAAFGGRRDRLLVLKLSESERHPTDLGRIAAAIHGSDNIRLFTAALSAADRHALTASADIVLSLHRAEGFGLVPAEAMLLGVPVVATGWSATREYMSPDAAALVPYRLVPACDERGVYAVRGAVWAEADIEAAADHLCQLADDPALRARLAAAGRDLAMARLGDDGLRDAIRELG